MNKNLSKVLFHGTDASLKPGDKLSKGSWATTRGLTAGLYGDRVYLVGKGPVPKKIDYKQDENNIVTGGHIRVIKEVNNPHLTGECGRSNCDFSEHD